MCPDCVSDYCIGLSKALIRRYGIKAWRKLDKGIKIKLLQINADNLLSMIIQNQIKIYDMLADTGCFVGTTGKERTIDERDIKISARKLGIIG